MTIWCSNTKNPQAPESFTLCRIFHGNVVVIGHQIYVRVDDDFGDFLFQAIKPSAGVINTFVVRFFRLKRSFFGQRFRFKGRRKFRRQKLCRKKFRRLGKSSNFVVRNFVVLIRINSVHKKISFELFN